MCHQSKQNSEVQLCLFWLIVKISRWPHKKLPGRSKLKKKKWSGWWDSNPRHQPWQGCALPLSYIRFGWPVALRRPCGKKYIWGFEFGKIFLEKSPSFSQEAVWKLPFAVWRMEVSIFIRGILKEEGGKFACPDYSYFTENPVSKVFVASRLSPVFRWTWTNRWFRLAVITKYTHSKDGGDWHSGR